MPRCVEPESYASHGQRTSVAVFVLCALEALPAKLDVSSTKALVYKHLSFPDGHTPLGFLQKSFVENTGTLPHSTCVDGYNQALSGFFVTESTNVPSAAAIPVT